MRTDRPYLARGIGYNMGQMRLHAEMTEGLEAFERFRQAVKKVLTVPKSSMPPSPFGKFSNAAKKPQEGKN
jgi:hypothetical protein